MSDYICEDNLSLVLRYLPVKSLLRFRCVSKGWKEIIDSPLFMQEHLSFQESRFLLQDEASPKYLVIHPHAITSIDILDGPVPNRMLSYLGTHNGVVCLCDDDLLLWNPSLRKSMSVPRHRLRDNMLPGWEYIDVEGGCFGFWIDPSSEEFKFISLNSRFSVDDEPMGVEGFLYSSIQQDWRVISPVEVGNWMSRDQGPSLMIQGVAHWRGYAYKDNAGVIFPCLRILNEDKPGVILSFDFALEKFELIEMPDLKHPLICHWKGTLALVSRDERVLHRYDVYSRQDGLWVNMFGFYVMPPISNVFWVLGEEERVRVLAQAYMDLVLCDTRDGIITLLDDYSEPYVSAEAYVAYDFVESLLFPRLIISDDLSDEYSDASSEASSEASVFLQDSEQEVVG